MRHRALNGRGMAKGARHLWGLGVAAIPALSMFVAQTLLLARNDTVTVLALAQFGGLIGLIFFAFDGQSGLAPAMLRLRHAEADIRGAYRLYRLACLLAVVAALPALFLFLAPEWWSLLISLPFCLALRFGPIDYDLDRRGWQHWGMLAQNGWMAALAVAALSFGRLDAQLAAIAAVAGTVPYALLHRSRPVARLTEPRHGDGQRRALADLVALILAQGMGQFYGRAVLFGVGSLFAGPVAALTIYAKQVFNAAGLLLLYLRRLELRAERAGMTLSLLGQAGIAAFGSIAVAMAAAQLAVPAMVAALLLLWQGLEKLFATTGYALQLAGRHDLAFAGLGALMLAGTTGMALAFGADNVLLFVALESMGLAAAMLLRALIHPPFPSEVRRS